jgi:hypothetical protein
VHPVEPAAKFFWRLKVAPRLNPTKSVLAMVVDYVAENSAEAAFLFVIDVDSRPEAAFAVIIKL